MPTDLKGLVDYIDYQRFADGSNRWLWCIYHDDRLWRGGVAHTFGDAKVFAHSSWQQLRDWLPDEHAAKMATVEELEAFDLNRLKKAGDADVVPPM